MRTASLDDGVSLILVEIPPMPREHEGFSEYHLLIFITVYCQKHKCLGKLEGFACSFSSKVPIMATAVHESTFSNVFLHAVPTLDL